MDSRAIELPPDEWERVRQLLTEVDALVHLAEPYSQQNHLGEGAIIYNNLIIVKKENKT